MTHALDLFARGFATHLADSLLEGTLIALIAWATLYLLRRRGAAVRFTVLLVAMTTTIGLLLLRVATHGHAGQATSMSVPLKGSWATALLAIWVAGAAVGFARLMSGYYRLMQIRQSCRPAEDLKAVAMFAELAAKICPSRTPVLLVSDVLQMPCAIGFIKPAVLLPASLLEDLPREDFRQVLVHELAHLRRWDDWSNLLQRTVKALLFFHPAMWWVDSRMSLEREMACDDAVLEVAPAGQSYAACLVRLAEYRLMRKGLALAQAAVGRVRQLSARINRLLAIDGRCPAPLGRSAITLASVAAVVMAGALAQAPVLISFRAAAPVSMAAGPSIQSRQWIGRDTPRVVNTTWAQPASQVLGKTPAKTPAVTRAKSTPVKTDVGPRVMQASYAPTRYQEFVVVVAGPEGFAVWHVTSWQVPATQRQPVGRTT